MDDNLSSNVAAALRQYCETVTQHNLQSIRIIVETMEAQPRPANMSASIANMLHMQEMRRLLQGAVPNAAQSPRDLLKDELRSELVKRASLNGVSPIAVNTEQRDEYFAALQSGIAKQDVNAAEFPPADLRYLCALTSGVTGPGLPYYQEYQQFDFVSAIEDHDMDEMTKCVVVPSRSGEEDDFDEFTGLWEGWDISVAVKIGGGPQPGGSWVFYCRDDNKNWAWRYGLQDGEWCSNMHDSVASFLGFYAHFNEQTEEDIRKSVRSLKTLI